MTCYMADYRRRDIDMSYMEQKMQEQMEGAEQEYNQLMEEYEPPKDWASPQWELDHKCHNWRGYVTDGLRWEWPNFTGRQKIMLASRFESFANNEEWD